MNSITIDQSSARSDRPGAASRTLLKLLERLSQGSLEMELPDGSQRRFGESLPKASMRVHRWRTFDRALKSGDVGFAEGFIEGDWDTPDLSALLTLLVANRDALERAIYGSWAGSLWLRLRHALNRNTRSGSARNIHAHYDLGNEFYALWLDGTMNYSSAWFEGEPTRELSKAQDAKVNRALLEVGAAPGQRILEVGCGWGALAEMAASRMGAHVTGVTLSHEQLAWAKERLERQGLAPLADLRLQDYRDLPQEFSRQPFDSVVSIEMFEAVGRAYWDRYFETLYQCLKPGGLACIQSITLREDLFSRYQRSSDFIQQYIFPGGMLPSISAFEAHARKAGFSLVRQHRFGKDYARTLSRWQASFMARESAVRALGFDTHFIRVWQFYLAYCEAAFEQGNTDVVQFTLQRN